MSVSPALIAAVMARAPRDFDLDFRRGNYRRNGRTIPQLIGIGGISHSQSGACWEIGADGSLVQFASNQARVVPGLGLWARSGFTNRADISASKTAWSGNSNTVPASLDNQGLAPDGTNSAWMIPAEAVGGPRNQRNYTIPADTATYVWSVFVKALEPGATVSFRNNGVWPSKVSSAVFNFADLSFSAASNGMVTPIANGWYRLDQSFTNPGTDTTFLMTIEALASTVGKVLFWGATFGISSSPVPYIPSPTTADVSNGPSVMTLPFTQRDTDFAMLVGFNSAQGPTAIGRTALALGDGSSRNRIRLGLYPGTGTSYVEVRAGDVGLLTAGVPGGRVFSAERGVIGLRRRGGRYSLGESFSGSMPSFSAEFSAMALPAGISAMDIGHTITASQFNGLVERVRVLEGTFSDSEFAGLITDMAA